MTTNHYYHHHSLQDAQINHSKDSLIFLQFFGFLAHVLPSSLYLDFLFSVLRMQIRRLCEILPSLQNI